MMNRACAALLLGAVLALCGCAGDADQDVQPVEEHAAEADREVASASAGVQDVPTSALAGALCVIEYMGNDVAFLDAATGERLDALHIGVNPSAVAVDSAASAAYVANSGSGEVARIAIDGSMAVDKVRVGTQPMALALDEARGLLYVADYHLNSVRIVDTTLMSLVGTVALEASGYEDREIAPACCYDPLDGTVMQGRKPVSLALSPDGSTLYCANIGTYDVSRIDLEAREEEGQFDGVIGFRDVVVTADGAHLLCAGVGSDLVESPDLVVLDAASGEEAARVAVGAAVSGVALADDGATAVAVARDDGVLAKIDVATWRVVASADVGYGAADVAVSADGARAYVGNSFNGSVTCVDLDSMQVVYRAESLADPRFLALVPDAPLA